MVYFKCKHSTSQVLNVTVPFIFKYAVDYLNQPAKWLGLEDPGQTILTTAFAIMLACKLSVVFCFVVFKHLCLMSSTCRQVIDSQ